MTKIWDAIFKETWSIFNFLFTKLIMHNFDKKMWCNQFCAELNIFLIAPTQLDKWHENGDD